MKIVCEACQAKYSISDDKVQGKVFKIRCKKCSHIIVVRSVTAATERPAPDASVAVEAPADAAWHLVVDQEQVGPLTVAEVEQKFAAGEVNAETYTWREGLADWLPLGEIDTFAAFVRPIAATAADDQVSAMFSGGEVANHGGGFAAAPAANAAAQPSAAAKLRGERNESSILFSLNNLSDLAVAPRRAPNATPASATPRPSAGAATGEGSGLIDIRSMASAYLGAAPAGAAAIRTASTIGSIDDLPVFGGSGFAEPSVLVPSARPTMDRRLVFLMIAALALLALLATVLLVMLSGRDKSEPKQVADLPPTATPALAPDPSPRVPIAAAPTVQPHVTATTPELTPPARPASPASSRPAASHGAPARPAAAPNRAAHASPTRQAAPAAATNECEEVQCVLNGYEGECCRQFRRTPSPGPKPDPTKTNLQDSIDRSMISAGIDSVKPRVMACGNKSPAKGKVVVKVAVAGSGSVKSVSVESTPDPALGACVSATVQRATFASTQRGGSFRVPFVF